jgi:hypothetical protein
MVPISHDRRASIGAKRRVHTWYELIYRQCLLRLIRNTSGLGSSSSLRGLAFCSPFDLADFLDFFFFFFLGIVASSGAGVKTDELTGEGLVKVGTGMQTSAEGVISAMVDSRSLRMW